VRQPSPDDRRVKHVRLTAAGHDLRGRLLATVGRPAAALDRLEVGEQIQLRDLLAKLLEAEATDDA